MKLFQREFYLRINGPLQLFLCLFLIGGILGTGIVDARAEDAAPTSAPQDKLQPLLSPDSPDYRTPRAGEGFTTKLFGREITVQPKDRRSVTALDLGAAIYAPGADNRAIIPFGAVYLWRHPDDQHLLRGDIVGLYNDIFWAGPLPQAAPLEWVLTLNTYTLPFSQYELIDGQADKSERLIWGYVRPGIGLGYRQKVSPGHQDNMFAVDLTIEPGYLFFAKDSKAASNFTIPQSTFELREHLQVRFDAFERNLLSLPHRGIAAGADVINGNRTKWRNWGLNSSETDGRDYQLYSAYLLGAGGVPGVDSDRHRLLGSVHAGVGSNLDRFSATRIGGGVLTMGEEYGSTWRPVLPGSIIQEYFPKHYAVAVGEYRWEALFFTYLSLDASVGWLDRLRQSGPDITNNAWKDSVFYSMGGRITTGFFFDTRMSLAYNYDFSEIRSKDRRGGHEIVLHFSRDF